MIELKIQSGNITSLKRNEEHPTMKPLELVGKAIANSSRVGEVVLDLFGGSGSTLLAADQPIGMLDNGI